jgi:hypothetical protein
VAYGASLAEGSVRTGPLQLVGSAWGAGRADRLVGRGPVRPGDAVVVAGEAEVDAVLECARRGLLTAGASGGVDGLAAVVAEQSGCGVRVERPVEGRAYAFTVPADRLDEVVSVFGRQVAVGLVRGGTVS